MNIYFHWRYLFNKMHNRLSRLPGKIWKCYIDQEKHEVPQGGYLEVLYSPLQYECSSMTGRRVSCIHSLIHSRNGF